MTRVAFVDMNPYKEPNGGSRFCDPVHLVPMANICKKNGNQTKIFQNGLDPRREIAEFRPEILGLSFIGSSKDAISDAQQLIKSLKPRPITVIGGTDIKYHADYYAEQFGPYFSRLSDSGPELILVSNEGEAFIEAYAGNGFNFELAARALSDMSYRDSGDRLGFGMLCTKNAYILSPLPVKKLDDLDFTRDYNVGGFETAQVKWESGCWGSCFYCGNDPKSIDYRSPELVGQELRELKEKGVKGIGIASANFTANPDRASAIVSVLSYMPHGYYFLSRVDSLDASLKRHPEAWKRFARFGNTIGLGIERFTSDHLVGIGKYKNKRQAMKQEERLKYILELFKGTATTISFSLMNLDWKMDLAEAQAEAERAQAYLAEYPDNVEIRTNSIGSHIIYDPGSQFSKSMAPVDYLRFKRDPRLLLLVALMMERRERLPFVYSQAESRLLEKHFLAFYLGVIDRLKAVPTEKLDLDQATETFSKKNNYSTTKKSLCSKLGFWETRRLERDINGLFNKMIDVFESERDSARGLVMRPL
ncbi:MAG: radical SAM protein [Candidatus Margulisiibacteriota bacterium]